MRLTTEQISAIKELAIDSFGEQAVVHLFGSRTDDRKRGGDIDLYIETDMRDLGSIVDAKLRFLAKLKYRIGDQRIDVVLNYPTRRRLPAIIDIAKQTGVRL